MTIETTIEYVSPPGAVATVMGSPILVNQDANGFILHAGNQVQAIRCKISDPDTKVTLSITPSGANTVIVEKITITCPQVLAQPDDGGVTWAAAANGQDITFTAPAFVNGKRDYVFSPFMQPPVKLKVTVLRT
jgi:hypothetical protein